MTDFARRYPRLIFLLPTFCLLLLGGLSFRDLVFGDRVLLYRDIGSDSFTDYYPWFVHFSDYIRNDGIPSWSFSVGMGQDIFYLVGYLILEPVTWLRGGLMPTHWSISIWPGFWSWVYCFFGFFNSAACNYLRVPKLQRSPHSGFQSSFR